MTEKVENKRMRQPYRKPQLEQVQLMAEEAVLAGCKTNAGGSSPNKTPCLAPPGPFCKTPTT
jgi:hypothetical protein